MKTDYLKIAALVIGSIALQQMFLSQFEILNVHINLPLLLALCGGMAMSPQRAVITAFSAGLVHDVFLSTPLGVSAFSYTLAASLVLVLLDETHDLDFASAILVAFGSAVTTCCFVLIATATGSLEVPALEVAWVAVVLGLVNGILSVVMIRLLRLIFNGQSSTQIRTNRVDRLRW